jgi:hypothetical protein
VTKVFFSQIFTVRARTTLGLVSLLITTTVSMASAQSCPEGVPAADRSWRVSGYNDQSIERLHLVQDNAEQWNADWALSLDNQCGVNSHYCNAYWDWGSAWDVDNICNVSRMRFRLWRNDVLRVDNGIATSHLNGVVVTADEISSDSGQDCTHIFFTFDLYDSQQSYLSTIYGVWYAKHVLHCIYQDGVAPAPFVGRDAWQAESQLPVSLLNRVAYVIRHANVTDRAFP